MNNKIILFIVILAVVFSGVIWFLGNKGGEISVEKEIVSPQATPTPTEPTTLSISTPTPTPSAVVPKTMSINMTDSGFSPSEVTINAGDTVRFINQGSQAHWPASAVHPVHEAYPGSSIAKCGTAQAGSIFDACRGLNNGESFSFTFNAKGSWPFHDHLVPFLKGKVIVQ